MIICDTLKQAQNFVSIIIAYDKTGYGNSQCTRRQNATITDLYYELYI